MMCAGELHAAHIAITDAVAADAAVRAVAGDGRLTCASLLLCCLRPHRYR